MKTMMKKTNVKVLALVCMSLVLGSSALGAQPTWETVAQKLGIRASSNKRTHEENLKEFYNHIGNYINFTNNGAFNVATQFTLDTKQFNVGPLNMNNITMRDIDFMYKNCSAKSSDGFLAFFQGWKSLGSVLILTAIGTGLGFLGRGLMEDKDGSQQDNS